MRRIRRDELSGGKTPRHGCMATELTGKFRAHNSKWAKPGLHQMLAEITIHKSQNGRFAASSHSKHRQTGTHATCFRRTSG